LKSTSNSQLATLNSRLLPYAVFALLALVSWNRWIEPYVDSGRELMVPWRIAHGERLYADVHFHHGPLGPWAAAAVDAVFGRSLAARLALAAALALSSLEALRRLSLRMLTAGRAALSVSAAVAAAYFLRPGGWMFPFSLDVAIAVAALTWSLELFLGGRDRAAGACVCAALLARPELAAAGLAVLAFSARREPRRLARLAAIPILAGAAGYAAVSVGIPHARLVADGWLRLLDPPEAFRNVYRAYAGLDRPGLRLVELALAALVLAVGVGLLVGASAVAERVATTSIGAARAIEGVTVLAVAAAAAWRLAAPAGVAERLELIPPLVRVLPPILLAAALLRAVSALRRPRSGATPPAVPDAVLWMAAVFSLRMLLAAGYVGPYDSFFLPLPLVVGAAGAFAAAERAAPSVGPALPRLAAACLAVFALFRIARTAQQYRGGTWQAVATPAGRLMLPAPVGAATAAAILDLDHRLPQSGTLTGFPEAGFYNYVLGRRNPLRLEQFFPGHLDASGEAETIDALVRTPPDALILANVLAVGEGSRAFGLDYNRALERATRERFERAAIFGPGARDGARIGDPGFFVEILVPRRNAAEGSAAR
jgi:hypothetical protein